MTHSTSGGAIEIPRNKANGKLTIVPLGGMGEIGKNMTAISYNGEMILIEAGLAFPESDMLGIDVVIPDITYLQDYRGRIAGLFLTHGHEDHIGGVPYLLRQMQVPIFATRLTLGLVEQKLAEHGLRLPEGSRSFRPGEHIQAGPFRVEPFRVNHSIPDSVGFILHTPVGVVVHTGDFKIDHTPVDGQVADLHRLAQIGRSGVLALLSDSTNAERPGVTPSERTVGDTLLEVMQQAPGRVLVASFASNVHRIQQVINAAVRFNRRVAVVGRSMENTVQVALQLGYLEVPEGTLVPLEEIRRIPVNRLAILTTGSQGEPMSALSRMATGEHRWVEIVPGDTVVISATPVPGNESMVYRTIDNLYRLGAEVISQRTRPVHVSGHGSQEEQKLVLNLLRPRYFIPIHGEYRHLRAHARLAREVGIAEENILVGDNGTIFELSAEGGRIAGKAPAGNVLVDGLGVGDVGNIVLRDRRQLSQDGILIVVVAIDKLNGTVMAGPDIVSRGFVYVRESEELLEQTKSRVAEAIAHCEARQVTEWSAIKSAVRDAVGRYLFEKTRRRPMILPIILEV